MPNHPLIEGSIEIDAPPAAVRAIASDLQRMGEWSPQRGSMKVFGGDVRLGSRTLNINGQGKLRWPTNARVVAFEPGRKLAFRIVENRTIWTYELEPMETGTKVTESRTAPNGGSGLSNLATKAALGGTEKYEHAHARGINRTLERIKAEAEKVSALGSSS